MITQDEFDWYLNNFFPLLLKEMYRGNPPFWNEKKREKKEREEAIRYIILRLYSLLIFFFFSEISEPLQELLPKYI